MDILIRWILYSFAIIFVAWIIPGIQINGIFSALFTAIILGLINSFIKPILLVITMPINFITLGLFTLILNALLLWLAGQISPGFEVNGFWSAFFGALILSFIGGFIGGIGKDDVKR